MGNQVNFKSESEATPTNPLDERRKVSQSSNTLEERRKVSQSSNTLAKGNPNATKMLLLGTGYSGKTTTFYQVFSRYHDNTESSYLNQFIARVRYNCYEIALNLITYCNLETSEARYVQMNYDGKKFQNTQDFLETLKELDPVTKVPKQAPTDCTDLFKELIAFYKQSDIEKHINTFKQSPMWFDGTEYFVQEDNLKRIGRKDYQPTNIDILKSRLRTTGMYNLKFSVDGSNYELWDVGGQRTERKKWKQSKFQTNLSLVFDKTDILIYLISLSDYTENIFEDNKNRMKESLETFENTIKGEWFKKVPTIILWNKSEKLKEMIVQEDRLKETFPEYKGGQNYENALHFIQSLFLEKVKAEDYYQVTGSAIDDTTILEVFKIILEIQSKKKISPEPLK